MRHFKKTKSLSFIMMGLAMMVTFKSFAQDKQNNFWERVRIGGGIGLSFGDGFFSGTLAPSAIYDFNEQFSAGVGLNGTYNSLRNQYNSTIIGGSVIALYNVIPQLQLSTEFEQLHVSRNYDNSIALADQNYWYPALFLGAGFRQQNFTIGLRYDVLFDNDRSVYASAYIPFVRVYF